MGNNIANFSIILASLNKSFKFAMTLSMISATYTIIKVSILQLI